MNLQQIFTGSAAEMDKYARFWQNQNLDFSSGANKLANGKYTLNKLKMKAGDGLLVIPVMLHLALDFSGHKLIDPVPYVGSVRTAISLVKTLAKNNANYADGLKELIGEDSFNKLNLADVGTVTDDEYAIFKRFRQPLVYQRTVMSVRAADKAFGRSYAVEIATDNETGDFIDSPKNPLIYKYHRLETACIAARIKKMRDDNASAGDSARTEAELSNSAKDLWKNRCISNPYHLGTTRVLFFDTDRNYNITPEASGKWTKDNLKGFEFYIKINKNLIDSLSDIFGSKYDRYEDFLLIKQQTPAFDSKTMAQAALKMTRTAAGSDEAIETMLPDFKEGYQNYRDNIDNWSDKIILSSAFEYKTISDTAITDIFKNNIADLAAAMHTQEISGEFSDTIAQLDSKLSDEILESALTGDAPQVGDISAEIAAAPVVSENTPGYGGDSLPDDDTESVTNALLGALAADSNG